MSEARPKRTDALRNRDLILDAAAVALARSADATLLDIATLAGVSRATVYRHFSDMQAVRDALLAELEEVGRTVVQEHLFAPREEGEPEPSLTDQIVRILHVALPVESRYSRATAGETLPEAGLVATFGPIAKAMVKQGQDQSEFRKDLPAELMADTLIMLAFHASRRVHTEGLPLEQAVQIVATWLRGMETSPRPTWDTSADRD